MQATLWHRKGNAKGSGPLVYWRAAKNERLTAPPCSSFTVRVALHDLQENLRRPSMPKLRQRDIALVPTVAIKNLGVKALETLRNVVPQRCPREVVCLLTCLGKDPADCGEALGTSDRTVKLIFSQLLDGVLANKM
jgi:hypothetical protein